MEAIYEAAELLRSITNQRLSPGGRSPMRITSALTMMRHGPRLLEELDELTGTGPATSGA